MPRKSTKTAAKAAEAAAVEAIEPRAEEIKTEVIAEPKEAEAVKAPAKKSAAGTAKTAKTEKVTKTAKTEEPKTEEPRVEETKAEAPKTKKAPARAKNVESVLHIQYGGRSYSQEDLMNIARDVWKYDLKHKEGELESVELYVKPEENKVYYVMNGESGSFSI